MAVLSQLVDGLPPPEPDSCELDKRSASSTAFYANTPVFAIDPGGRVLNAANRDEHAESRPYPRLANSVDRLAIQSFDVGMR